MRSLGDISKIPIEIKKGYYRNIEDQRYVTRETFLNTSYRYICISSSINIFSLWDIFSY